MPFDICVCDIAEPALLEGIGTWVSFWQMPEYIQLSSIPPRATCMLCTKCAYVEAENCTEN